MTAAASVAADLARTLAIPADWRDASRDHHLLLVEGHLDRAGEAELRARVEAAVRLHRACETWLPTEDRRAS